MQLDQTHVVIRVRTMGEIGDLAMAVLRRYPSSLLIGFVLGATVWALANTILLGWIPIREAGYGLEDEEALWEIYRYVAWMAVLVSLQAPAAGVLTTLYLGQAVFEHRPSWRSVLNEAKRQARSWLWVLGVRGMAIPSMILLACRWGQSVSVLWDGFVPALIVLLMVVLRGSRPFIPEILLLEECPLRSTSPSTITLAARSRSLHSPMSGELAGRFLTLGFVFAGLTLCVLYTLMAIRGVLLLQWNVLDLLVLLVLFPLALWTVAGISVIVRLLSYIDTRIRLEGWEVELAVRAEVMRQFGQDASPRAMDNASSQKGSGRARSESARQSAVAGTSAGSSSIENSMKRSAAVENVG